MTITRMLCCNTSLKRFSTGRRWEKEKFFEISVQLKISEGTQRPDAGEEVGAKKEDADGVKPSGRAVVVKVKPTLVVPTVLERIMRTVGRGGSDKEGRGSDGGEDSDDGDKGEGVVESEKGVVESEKGVGREDLNEPDVPDVF